jgi:hypothetical protein
LSRSACACTQYDSLTSVANLKSLFARDKVKWPELTWITTDSLTGKGPSTQQALPPAVPASVAFLQYTSGGGHAPTSVQLHT